MEGIFGLYKPKGPTSFMMIRQLRKILNLRKIGHAGTLDPMASGVLVIAAGRNATKQLTGLIKKDKEYVAVVRLGVISTSDDEEGEKIPQIVEKMPTREDVEMALQKFIGDIEQVPPAFSALKIQGVPAYKLARRGIALEMQSRLAHIDAIEIMDFAWPDLKLRVACASGVYIRALARDIGKELGCGAYLADLERTRVGDYTLGKALTLEQIKNNENKL